MTLAELYKWGDNINNIASASKRGRAINEWFENAILIESDECLLWPFGKDGHGYGNMKIEGTNKKVHVQTAIKRIGPNIENKEVAHGPCHKILCFNYRHLSYKSHLENQRDKQRDKTNIGNPKIPNSELAKIVHLRDITNLTFKQISELVNVSESYATAYYKKRKFYEKSHRL